MGEYEKLDDQLDLVLSGRQYKRFQELYYNPVLEEYALNMVDLCVLLFLYEHENLDTAKDIVSMRCLTKSYVSKSVDKLIERGFLGRKHLREDRRYVHLLVREEALPVIRAVHIQQKRMMQKLFAGVSEEEIKVLGQVARKLSGNISDLLLK